MRHFDARPFLIANLKGPDVRADLPNANFALISVKTQRSRGLMDKPFVKRVNEGLLFHIKCVE